MGDSADLPLPLSLLAFKGASQMENGVVGQRHASRMGDLNWLMID